jgi:DNA-binding SARP family transcriptional activator
LTALLWGDVPGDQARHSLRQALLALRRALPPGTRAAILVEGDQIAVDPRAVEVDVAAFEQLAARQSQEDLERAVALYRGDLLEGLAVREPAFEDWLRAERERLRETGIRTLRKLLSLQTEDGALERAVETAMRLLALDPLQEVAHRTLMQLYDRLGRRAAALRQYGRCVGVLRRELGVAPEIETRRVYQALTAAPETTASGQRPARSRVDGQEIPLLGRDTELEHIRSALEDVRRGSGRAIIVSGEAGIGKTRLLQEVEACAQGFRRLSGRCYDLTRILPFGPWIEALRMAGMRDDPELLDRLGFSRRSELSRLLPELAGSDQPVPERAEDHARLFEAIADLVTELATRQPLLVTLEDIHWADELSLRLLFHLGRRLESARVLLAATLRDDEMPRGSVAHRMLENFEREWPNARAALAPLSKSHAVVLAHAIAKAGAPSANLEQVASDAWELSRGNPFMILETLRSLSGPGDEATGATRSRGVVELVERRIARLGDPALGVVAIVAVAGRDIEFDVLRRASDLSEREAADTVELLIRRRILREDGDRFDFVHDIVRQTADARLIAPQRRALHRLVAEALEAVKGPDLDEHLATLATHYLECGAWDKAVAYLARATNQAIERSAWRGALAFIERALAVLPRCADTTETQEQYIDLVLERYAAFVPLGLFRQADRQDLSRALVLAESLGDSVRLGRVNARLAQCAHATGEADRGKEYAHRAIAAGEAGGDTTGPALARIILAEILHHEGDDEQTIAVARRNIRILAESGVSRYFGQAGLPSVTARMHLALSLARQGEFPEALRCGHEALRIAESGDRPVTLSTAYISIASPHLTRGDVARAIPILLRGCELSLTRVGAHRSGYASMLGLAYVRAGRAREAIPLLEEGADRTALFSIRSEPYRLAPLALGYAAVGRLRDALRAAERGLDLARTHRSVFAEAWLLCVLALIALRREPPDIARALAYASKALARSVKMGTRPLSARCHLVLGRAHRRAGHVLQADEHLATATAMFREMQMPDSLEASDQPRKVAHA